MRRYIPGDICPHNISREIYVFFKVATHTCSQGYCKTSERRRVVVDGEERVEKTPRESALATPGHCLASWLVTLDWMCAWPPGKKHLSLLRCLADVYLQGYMSALYPSSVFSSIRYYDDKSYMCNVRKVDDKLPLSFSRLAKPSWISRQPLIGPRQQCTPTSVLIGWAQNPTRYPSADITVGGCFGSGCYIGIVWYLLLLCDPKPDPLNGRYPPNIRSGFWDWKGKRRTWLKLNG